MNIQVNSDRVFWTSDTHYAHKNMCRGISRWNRDDEEYFRSATRDFNTLQEMNDVIVNNINDTVGEDDILFHSGDWSFGGYDNIIEFRSRIKCKNIHLVLGNHDESYIQTNYHDVQSMFSSVVDKYMIDLQFEGKEYIIHMDHYPVTSWYKLNKGSYMLFGHCHSSIKGPGRTMDIGMDSRKEFKPYHFSEIIQAIGSNPIVSGFKQDHHNKEFS